MAFKENVLTNFNDILTASIAEQTPYQVAIDYVQDASDNGILDSKEKVEVVATMMGNIVTGITSQAISSAINMETQSELIVAQVATETNRGADIASNTTNKNALAQADLLIKEQQKIAEEIKNGSGDVAQSVHKKQKELLDKQIEKLIKDNILLETQNESLESQTIDNRILKSMDSLSEYIMGLGNAGLKPDKTFHTNLMLQQKAMMMRAGFTFEKVSGWNESTNNKYVVKDGDGVEVGTLDATPTASE